jgi:hypothetical protein
MARVVTGMLLGYCKYSFCEITAYLEFCSVMGRGGMRGDVPNGGAFGSCPVLHVCQTHCAPAELGLIRCRRPLALSVHPPIPQGEMCACEGDSGAFLRCELSCCCCCSCCGPGSPTARAALPNVPPFPPFQPPTYFEPEFLSPALLPPAAPRASRIAPAKFRFVLSIIVPPMLLSLSANRRNDLLAQHKFSRRLHCRKLQMKENVLPV